MACTSTCGAAENATSAGMKKTLELCTGFGHWCVLISCGDDFRGNTDPPNHLDEFRWPMLREKPPRSTVGIKATSEHFALQHLPVKGKCFTASVSSSSDTNIAVGNGAGLPWKIRIGTG